MAFSNCFLMITRLTYLFGLWVLSALIVSCSTPPHMTIYQTETEWVDLREWPSGYPVLTNLPHPADLEATQLRELLQNIQYRQSEIFSSHMGKRRPAFSEYQLALLAMELPKAFGQALPEEVIDFRVRNDQTSHLYTKGFCFIRQNEFHLIIQELQQATYDISANQARPPTVHWEFSPQPNQRMFSPSPRSTHDFPHWIIIPISKRSSYGLP